MLSNVICTQFWQPTNCQIRYTDTLLTLHHRKTTGIVKPICIWKYKLFRWNHLLATNLLRLDSIWGNYFWNESQKNFNALKTIQFLSFQTEIIICFTCPNRRKCQLMCLWPCEYFAKVFSNSHTRTKNDYRCRFDWHQTPVAWLSTHW